MTIIMQRTECLLETHPQNFLFEIAKHSLVIKLNFQKIMNIGKVAYLHITHPLKSSYKSFFSCTSLSVLCNGHKYSSRLLCDLSAHIIVILNNSILFGKYLFHALIDLLRKKHYFVW